MLDIQCSVVAERTACKERRETRGAFETVDRQQLYKEDDTKEVHRGPISNKRLRDAPSAKDRKSGSSWLSQKKTAPCVHDVEKINLCARREAPIRSYWIERIIICNMYCLSWSSPFGQRRGCGIDTVPWFKRIVVCKMEENTTVVDRGN